MKTQSTSANSVPKRCRTQPFVVVGCLIEKAGKFLFVQEAWGSQRGLWNRPAGWLNLGEKIPTGALREAEEETGLELELTGFVGVYTIVKERNGQPDHGVKFIFAARPLTEEFKPNPEEIMDLRWMTPDEVAQLGPALRDSDILQEIKDFLSGRVRPIYEAETFTSV